MQSSRRQLVVLCRSLQHRATQPARAPPGPGRRTLLLLSFVQTLLDSSLCRSTCHPTASTFMLLLFQRTLPTPPPPAVGLFVSVAFTVAPPSQHVLPVASPTAFLLRSPAALLLLRPFALPPFSPTLFAAHVHTSRLAPQDITCALIGEVQVIGRVPVVETGHPSQTQDWVQSQLGPGLVRLLQCSQGWVVRMYSV